MSKLGKVPPYWNGGLHGSKSSIVNSSTSTTTTGIPGTNTVTGTGIFISNGNISTGNSISTNSYNIQGVKTTYYVLGEELSVSGVHDPITASNLSLITILGKPYYDELIKNGVKFSSEISNFLNIVLTRDYKLSQILDNK